MTFRQYDKQIDTLYYHIQGIQNSIEWMRETRIDMTGTKRQTEWAKRQYRNAMRMYRKLCELQHDRTVRRGYITVCTTTQNRVLREHPKLALAGKKLSWLMLNDRRFRRALRIKCSNPETAHIWQYTKRWAAKRP